MKTNTKYEQVWLDPSLKRDIKAQAAMENLLIKDFVLKIFKTYMDDKFYIDEEKGTTYSRYGFFSLIEDEDDFEDEIKLPCKK